jgi:thiol-disulfide isomerase/thioredoxin
MGDERHSDGARPLMTRVEVTLVTGSGCGSCDRVKERLQRLQSSFADLSVTEVDIGSKEGTELAVRYRLGGLPGILINGRMALVGDVSEYLLRERINLASPAPGLQD